MSINFKYKSIPRPEPFGAAPQPTIPVTLRYGKHHLDVLALIDSGADISFIPRDIGELLGMRLKNVKATDTVGGIGGKVEVVTRNLRLTISNAHERYTLTIPFYVSVEKSDRVGQILLGREGLFHNFNITFMERDRKIRFKRRTDRK